VETLAYCRSDSTHAAGYKSDSLRHTFDSIVYG